MDWLTRRKYQYLLVTLVLLIVVYPLVGLQSGGRVLFDTLITVVFLIAIFVLDAKRRFRLISLLVGFPFLVGTWTGYVQIGIPRAPLAIGFHLITAAFLGITVVAMLGRLYRERAVTADSVYGAFCGYLLLGLAFGHLFSACEWLAPGSFRAEPAIASRLDNEWHRHFLLIYFSFMTLTTVGYGDLMPASDAVRGFVVVESVTGQFYIAVLVAELIGRRSGQRVLPESVAPAAPASESTVADCAGPGGGPGPS